MTIQCAKVQIRRFQAKRENGPGSYFINLPKSAILGGGYFYRPESGIFLLVTCGEYINRDSCQFGALYLHGKLIFWTKLCFANFFAAMFWLYGDLLGSKAGLFCSLQRKYKSRKEFQKVSLQKDNLRQGKFNFFLHFRKKSILQAKKGFPWIFHSVSGIFAPKHIIGC